MQHPYHYSLNKTAKHRLIDLGVPIILFLGFFYLYNFGKITPSEMIKTSGLLAITLLGVTLVVGPLSRIIPALDILKTHRKFWGILSFLIALVHVGLVVVFYRQFSLAPGPLSGLLAIIILFLVTMTSNSKALTKLSPKAWKIIQTTSYLALALAVAHFYLMEQVNGVLVIKRLLGQITFVFAILVIALRILILLLPVKKSNN